MCEAPHAHPILHFGWLSLSTHLDSPIPFPWDKQPKPNIDRTWQKYQDQTTANNNQRDQGHQGTSPPQERLKSQFSIVFPVGQLRAPEVRARPLQHVDISEKLGFAVLNFMCLCWNMTKKNLPRGSFPKRVLKAVISETGL